MINLITFYPIFLETTLLLLFCCQLALGQPTSKDKIEGYKNNTPPERYEANWASLDQRKTPTWFNEAKFGIFIHWGLYSVPSWAPTGDLNVYSKYAEWYWRSLLDEERQGHDQFVKFHNRTYGEDFKYQDFAPMLTAEMFDPVAWANLFKRAGAKYIVLTSKHHEGFCL